MPRPLASVLALISLAVVFLLLENGWTGYPDPTFDILLSGVLRGFLLRRTDKRCRASLGQHQFQSILDARTGIDPYLFNCFSPRLCRANGIEFLGHRRDMRDSTIGFRRARLRLYRTTRNCLGKPFHSTAAPENVYTRAQNRRAQGMRAINRNFPCTLLSVGEIFNDALDRLHFD